MHLWEKRVWIFSLEFKWFLDSICPPPASLCLLPLSAACWWWPDNCWCDVRCSPTARSDRTTWLGSWLPAPHPGTPGGSPTLQHASPGAGKNTDQHKMSRLISVLHAFTLSEYVCSNCVYLSQSLQVKCMQTCSLSFLVFVSIFSWQNKKCI